MNTYLSRKVALGCAVTVKKSNGESAVIPKGTTLDFDNNGWTYYEETPLHLYRFSEPAIGEDFSDLDLNVSLAEQICNIDNRKADILIHKDGGVFFVDQIGFGRQSAETLKKRDCTLCQWSEDLYCGKISAFVNDSTLKKYLVIDIPYNFVLQLARYDDDSPFSNLHRGDTIIINGKWAKLYDYGDGEILIDKYQHRVGRNNCTIDISLCANDFSRNLIFAELEGGQLVIAPYVKCEQPLEWNKNYTQCTLISEEKQEQPLNDENLIIAIREIGMKKIKPLNSQMAHSAINIPQSFMDLIYSEENKQDYIGMGNPNARILIIGREPNHDLSTEEGQCDFEQDQQMNRDNWRNLVEGRPVVGRCNPRRPFPNQKCLKDNGQNDGTAMTWVWYQKLVDLILGREYDRGYMLRPVDFHDYCFHTDISAAAAPGLATTDRTTKAASVVERSEQLFGHPFFKQFPIVILGIGTDVGQYVPLEWCEKVLGFPTSEVINIQEKPMIWVNGDSANGRVLIHTHCLSQPSYEYINKIREVIWENCLSDYCWPKAY